MITVLIMSRFDMLAKNMKQIFEMFIFPKLKIF